MEKPKPIDALLNELQVSPHRGSERLNDATAIVYLEDPADDGADDWYSTPTRRYLVRVEAIDE
jgi:hypothetical protein